MRTELNCKTSAAVRELLDMWKTYTSGVKYIKCVNKGEIQRCAVVVVCCLNSHQAYTVGRGLKQDSNPARLPLDRDHAPNLYSILSNNIVRNYP